MLTRDPILRGRLVLWQPREGYRFSVDPLLLLDFVAPPYGRACDLGTGSGIIALGLARADAAARVVGVELQPRLAAIARKNVAENGLEAQVSVLELDLADEQAARVALPGAAFDLVVSNPPYQPTSAGPANPRDESGIARHELRLTLAALIPACRRLLVPKGRAALVYPAERLTALLAGLDAEGLRPIRLRLVHDRADEPARRVLVEARKGARSPLVVEPPLILRDEGGRYTPAARRALGDDAG